MSTSDKKFAAVYQYDPLDRLIAANTAQRFYNNTRIATEIEGTVKRSFFEHDAQPLAQQQAGTTTLLAIDQQASVLHSVSTTQSAPHTYTPYGHRPVENGLLSVLGFNGERPDPLSGYYLLGQGYRAFNPALMRFNSPDSFSPFGEGGINAYAYCAGDPINSSDPTGHWPKLFKNLFKSGKSVKKPKVLVKDASVQTLASDASQPRVVGRPRPRTKPSTASKDLNLAKLKKEFDKTRDIILHFKSSIKKYNNELSNVDDKIKALISESETNRFLHGKADSLMSRSRDKHMQYVLDERRKLDLRKSELLDQRYKLTTSINILYKSIDELDDWNYTLIFPL